MARIRREMWREEGKRLLIWSLLMLRNGKLSNRADRAQKPKNTNKSFHVCDITALPYSIVGPFSSSVNV
jgi:hypothetical protein